MMRISPTDSAQKRLYIYNRTVPDVAGYADLLDIERNWAGRLAADHERQAPAFASGEDLLAALSKLLDEEEKAGPSEHERFLAEEATLRQFKSVVAAFAVDGLVESQSHLGIIRRLPARARTMVMQVLIDEFGCGNDEQEHAQLYTKLVTELGMPTDLEYYVGIAPDECFAYVNLFHWFAERAPKPEYFLGAYAYFESSVLYAFKCYAAASSRLGIVNSRYYTEHLYIDTFHSRRMRSSIRALERDRPVDLAKVWAGVTMTSAVVAEATEAALGRSRRVAA
ncbi:MAG TPA: iron-containing redox enzyme family protein [Streptosporangiaceae bacterium]|nr:iron-containing redox enzyme family protein [Streptosporangiaceae bacterium]